MNRRRLLNTPEHSTAMKMMHNADDEDYVLRRYPFHESRSIAELMRTYQYAIDLVFRDVESTRWDSVIGRLSRKLIKQRKVLEGYK